MNEITRESIARAARDNPQAAKRNDAEFRYLVSFAHWDLITEQNGVRLMHRALRLWMIFHPEQFDQGYIMSHEPKIFNNLILISEICSRITKRRIRWDPAWQLDEWDSNDIPDQAGNKQLKLF